MSSEKNRKVAKQPEQPKEIGRRTIQLSDRDLDTLQRMQRGIQDIQQAQASLLTNICVEQYEYPETAGLGFDFNFATGKVLVVEHEVPGDKPEKKSIET